MKVIIDIPESIIEHIKDGSFGARPDDKYLLAYAAVEGTPLPKGHGDLIDRGKTVKRICEVAKSMNEKLGSPYIMAALFIQDNKEEFPTIIEADKEAKTMQKEENELLQKEKVAINNGKKSKLVGKCPKCGWESYIDENAKMIKHCLNCGAKMEEE